MHACTDVHCRYILKLVYVHRIAHINLEGLDVRVQLTNFHVLHLQSFHPHLFVGVAGKPVLVFLPEVVETHLKLVETGVPQYGLRVLQNAR
ncbi:hypothetical protein L798_01879 [Zootermopsis nevadensis]|uniref:Uncharacterized protein n=1 Tax=Zootermopsis nevadensis TaxID=136037 RepID=A0A067RF69_ZOONE|nr:hypothetical protein L798_01879 [Zootermopsis nevadensis]